VTVAFASAAVALQAVRVLTAVISARTGSALASGLGAGSALLIVGSPLALGLVAATLTERAIGVGVFDAALGGDPSLFAALVATITHVMTTASLVGALGVVGSVIEQHVTRRLGRTVGVLLWLVAAFGALGGGGELVSLDTGAASSLRVGFFDAIHHALLLALVVRLVGALREGADVRAVPLHFGLAALSMLAIALPAGIALSTPLLGPFLHGSVFATARTHYLAVGGVLLALLAGLHQCWPELVGAEARRDRAFWGLATLVVGVQLSFLPMLVLGIQGAPRPLPPTLAPGWMTVSFVGLVLVVVGLVTIAGNLLSAIREPADGTPSAS
jgi:cytochrome c oxidase subunit 1